MMFGVGRLGLPAMAARADGTAESITKSVGIAQGRSSAKALGQVVSVGLAVERDVAMPVSAAKTVEVPREMCISTGPPAAPAPAPPHNAERLLLWLLPKARREAEIGDLEEEYRTIIVAKLGEREARFWYWWQGIRSVMRRLLVGSALVTAAAGAAKWLLQKLGP